MDRANLPALTLTTRGLSAATPVASPLKSPSLTATDYALEAVFVALLQAWHRSVNTAQVVRKSHPQMAFDFPDLKDIFVRIGLYRAHAPEFLHVYRSLLPNDAVF